MIFGLNISTANDFYIVKKGDTLTNILQAQRFNKSIYGKHGSLAQTLSLNPNIRLSGGNKIFPKMKIVLVNTQISQKNIAAENSVHQPRDSLRRAPVSQTEIPTEEKVVNDRLPSDGFKQSFYWAVSPSLSWKNLTSTDENIYRSSKVNATSNTNYGMSVSYGMHFEENADIYSNLSLESVSFFQDSSINLIQNKFLASRFGIGLSYQKKWHLEAAMSDEFFLTSPSSSNVDIKKVTLPEIKASYLKDFYQYRNGNLSYSLSGSAFLPRSSSDVKSKFSYGAGGALEAKLHNQSFKIGYDLNLLKANGNSTNYQNVYWKYTWETL